MPGQFRRIPVAPLNKGLNDSSNPLSIENGEAQDLLNVHFDENSIANTGGAVKFNNQSSPKPALRTSVDPSLSGLSIGQSDISSDTTQQSVPLRGYGYLPYSIDHDIGGLSTLVSGHRSFQQGRTFETKISFRIPDEEILFEKDQRGILAPAVGAGDAALEASDTRYDEALDECFCIVQKGGDRTAPMSWALAVVNVGDVQTVNGVSLPAARPSNYCLAFIWYDAPTFGWDWGSTPFRYNLSNPSASNSGEYGTSAFRCVIAERFVVPGRAYHVSVSLSMDTADVQNDSVWQDDGTFAIRIREDLGPLEEFVYSENGGSPTNSGLHAYKGPQDSLEYLCKYGIRFFGRDAMFLGLGFRPAPYRDIGFIPYGADACPLEHAGFQMMDRSTHTINRGAGNSDIYPNTAHTLTGTKGLNRFTANHAGLSSGNTNGGGDPLQDFGDSWPGLAVGASAAYNSECLRGYRVVPMDNGTGIVGSGGKGSVYTITGHSDSGSPPYADRIEVTPDPNGNSGLNAGGHAILIYPFRWHQRPLDLWDLRIYRTVRDYTDARVRESMRSYVESMDILDPDKDELVANWKISDGGGGTLKEEIKGADGYRAPFELGVGKCGCRGENQVFLSGEGECLSLDLSENPVAVRELANNLNSEELGFAIEVTLRIPEAYYGVDHTLASGDHLGRYAPYLISWDLKDPDGSELETSPKPLLRFGHRLRVASADVAAFDGPLSFQLSIMDGSDQEDVELPTTISAWDGAGANRWSDEAEWVGETVTFQVGVESLGAGLYTAYIAAAPKDLLNPEAGDPRDAETAITQAVTIRGKDILRSVINIGGVWDPIQRDSINDGFELGYSECNARIIVDEIRVFGAAAPGELAPISTGRGKIRGDNAYPRRELEGTDIVQPLGGSVTTATVVDGSVTVSAPGNQRFFIEEPENSINAVKRTYLVVTGDDFQLNNEETEPDFFNEFYWIRDVALNGDTATLSTPYGDLGRTNAAAGSFRLLGYTAFRDSLDDRPLTLGGGSGFLAGVTTTSEVSLSRQLFTNFSPVSSLSLRGGERKAGWRVRVYSPIGAQSSNAFRTKWVRAHSIPRWNPILGLHSQNEEIYAASQGVISQVDDRWREDGPTFALQRSVIFHAKKTRNGLWLPRQNDRIRCVTAADNVWPYATVALHDDKAWVFDAWVYCFSTEGIQTIAWLGTDLADPTAYPSTTSEGKQLGWWFRLNNGRPEFVLNSIRAGSVTTPEDGRYIATALSSIAPNQWVQVRCTVPHVNLGGGAHDAQIPIFKIHGRTTTSAVNATDTLAGPAGNWIRVTGKGGGIPASGAFLLVGSAFDFYRTRPEDMLFDQDAWFGENQHGRTQLGFMHNFNGMIGQVVVWSLDTSDPSVGGNYDPANQMFPPNCRHFALDLEEGIGHKTKDDADNFVTAPTPCLIESHPFISLWHEFGSEEERVSFANSADEIFCANGGRVVTIEDGVARPSGLIAPTLAPAFSVERNPIWKPNSSTPDLDNEPIAGALPTAEDQINHYRTLGRNYMTQEYTSDMEWDDDGAGNIDTLAFKCLVKFSNVTGRSQLWGMRDSVENGKALEVVDGKLRLTWFDTFLKKNVWIETSRPVVNAGSVHYIYVRKKWPPRDPVMGNWLDSVYGDGRLIRLTFSASAGTLTVGTRVRWPGAGANSGYVTRIYYDGTGAGYIEILMEQSFTVPVSPNVIQDFATGLITVTASSTGIQPAYDSIVVRRFPQSATRETEWDAKTDGSTYNAISFTTLGGTHPNHTASGRVTPPGLFVTITVTTGATTCGIAADLTHDTAVATAGVFHKDMVGMYLQTSSGTLYRISAFTDGQNITVTDLDGTGPSAGETSVEAAVFVGTKLVQSDEFDDSDQPDDSVFDIDYMGTAIQVNPTNGLVPFEGEVWDTGWVVQAYTDDNLDLFWDFTASAQDIIEAGTDTFAGAIYSATPPGGLNIVLGADNYTHIESTQPNEDLEIEQGDGASSLAKSLFWNNLSPTALLSGDRRIRVTFFDPFNNIESNPSPELLITAQAEEKVNPSGETRIRLTNLPISPDGDHVQRWIYMSPVDALQLFRIKVLNDNTSSSISIFEDESTIASGPPIRFDQGAPPRAKHVAFSQGSMWYANLGERAGDRASYIYSLPFRPHAVPRINLSTLESGSNAEITGMVEHNGGMLVFKRNAIWRVILSLEGLPIEKRITFDGTGAVSQQSIVQLDDRTYFIANRGPSMVNSANRPEYLGDRMERYTNNTLDATHLKNVSAAINRRRNQYTWTSRRRTDDYTRDRISIEFDHELAGLEPRIRMPALHRISKYRDPNLTALGEADREEGGVRVMIGGTREGFVVYLDRTDTSRAMMGADETLWGDALVTAAGTPTVNAIQVTGTLVDTDLEGLRGVPIRWRDTGGVEHEGLVAFSENVGGTITLHLDEDVAVAPAAGQVIALGFIKHFWKSKAFKAETPDLYKIWRFFDVLRDKESAGSLQVSFFRDREASAPLVSSVDLTKTIVPISTGQLQAYVLEILIESLVPNSLLDPPDLSFRLVELVLRVDETDNI